MTAQLIDRAPTSMAAERSASVGWCGAVTAAEFDVAAHGARRDIPAGRIDRGGARMTERPIAPLPSPRVRCARSERRTDYVMSRWQRLAMTTIVAAGLIVGTVTVLSGQEVPVGAVVTAQPGDTVGSIVLRELPGADPLRAVELVESLNGLAGDAVPAGASIRLPALP